ncbi:MAG: response regulator [Thermodesulfobacteriota bacterium]|nr:response regulator [Deltaproteobacteria bacterium]MBW1833842.1 response regulator [Deltaproteobacteria bacterium]MBW2165611.1 response regulator [Deltaproteobacteria bacterium]MEA1899461.1 response regulator [Thermodesulfobacteriota bacterium]
MEEIRMLLVDDEDDFRTTLANRLKLRKIDITDVASGNEAIELVRQKSFDVAIIDVKMPGIDGIETLKQIKQLQPDIEIVMLTGHASIESGMEAMKLGAYDYVMKPCDIDELLIKTGEAYQNKLLKEKEK